MKLLAHKYLIGSILVILAGLWLLTRKGAKPGAPEASVELGVGTVGGNFGGDYDTPRIVQQESEIDRLIRVSSERIHAFDMEQQEKL